VALLTRWVDFAYNVQEAIEAPRWVYGPVRNTVKPVLRIESRVASRVRAELEERGHTLLDVGAWSNAVGHAQAIEIDRRGGLLHGGADPRADGIAIGW